MTMYDDAVMQLRQFCSQRVDSLAQALVMDEIAWRSPSTDSTLGSK